MAPRAIWSVLVRRAQSLLSSMTELRGEPESVPDRPASNPDNLLLILVPLMPTLRLAVLVLLIRFSISQMDVPTRQSYTMAVVEPGERSAAGGFTAIARTSGATISPIFAGFLFARPTLINFPFYIAGTLKVMYDLLLFASFQKHRPPEEREK